MSVRWITAALLCAGVTIARSVVAQAVAGGGNGVADRSTFLSFAGAIPTSAEYCADQIWAANNARTCPVTDGHIHINP